MKGSKLNFSIIDWVILVVFISLIGLDTFLNFIITILKTITGLKFFSTGFDLVKFISENTTIIFGVYWLDKLLLLIASAIPSIVLFILGLNFKMPKWLSALISILIYFAVIYLFTSIVFWILLAIVIIALITWLIIKKCIKKNN